MFGLGYSNYAPGTVASIVTCLSYIWFYNLQIDLVFLILNVFLIFIFSAYSIDLFKDSFTQIDAKEIVIDEFIGQSIPVLTVYSLIEKNNLSHFILFTFISFILFRIFDILKPFPINIIDRKMKNGFGVILDDIVAGVYSVLIILTLIFFIDYA
ncbi:MAG: phosphatidylglycerophosphatase A [Pelagibacteraceae bacterium]|nr:phosphatidylglycerophosphatase A [Pelagibacteraceae bacterium]